MHAITRKQKDLKIKGDIMDCVREQFECLSWAAACALLKKRMLRCTNCRPDLLGKAYSKEYNDWNSGFGEIPKDSVPEFNTCLHYELQRLLKGNGAPSTPNDPRLIGTPVMQYGHLFLTKANLAMAFPSTD